MESHEVVKFYWSTTGERCEAVMALETWNIVIKEQIFSYDGKKRSLKTFFLTSPLESGNYDAQS